MVKVKRLLIVLQALYLLFMIGAAVVALKLKRSRQSVGDEESAAFDFTTIFDSLKFKSRAAAFRDGAWLAYFGGGELDLSGAQLDSAGATLRLRAIMGGGEISVPSDCRVEVRARHIMGGIQNDAGEPPEEMSGPTLVIEGSTLMGGFHLIRGEAVLSTEAAATAPVDEVEIGTVDHYFNELGVVGVKLTDHVGVGDTIHIKGQTTDLVHAVDSMQIDKAAVEQADSGDSVGIIVDNRCRVGDKVFLVDG